MAEERRKGAPDRRRGRAASAEQAGKQSVTSPGSPAAQADDEARPGNPNEAAAFDAGQLDESIRARQKEDRGEVF